MARIPDTTGAARKSAKRDNEDDMERVALAADWDDISAGLRKDLGHQLHSQWIKPVQLGDFDADTGTLALYLPSEFAAEWVRKHFADRLSLAWKIMRSEIKKVAIEVHPSRKRMADIALGDSRSGSSDGPDLRVVSDGGFGDPGFSSVGLDASLTFAAFVTGDANVLARNAAQRMAATDKPQFSPLYIKAATGQGKTHLLHAIGHQFLGQHPTICSSSSARRARRKNCFTRSITCFRRASDWSLPPTVRRRHSTAWSHVCSAASRWVWSRTSSPPIWNFAALFSNRS